MDRAAEVAHKVGLLRGWLASSDRDAVLIGSQAGFGWITAGGHDHVAIGEQAGVAALLVTDRTATLLTTNIELPRLLDEEVPGLPLEPVGYPWWEPDAAPRAIAERCDPARTVADVPLFGIAAAGDGLAALRYTLLDSEMTRLRALARDAAEAVELACLAVRPGDTEHDVAAELAHQCRRRGILPLVDLVAADERIACYRHPLPTGLRLQRTLLVALTGRRHGLHASLTRMVSFGPPDDELRARHAAVTRVDAAVNLASRPGTALSAVLAVAAESYAAEGFADEWHHHHQGGLTGYAGREIFATPAAGHRLERSQATTWNPSITRVKSEDTVLVALGSDDGPDVVTRTDAWPQVSVEVPAGVLDRPALLQR